MKNSKALSIIMNIIITLLAIFCFLSFIEMSGSFKYAKNQEEKRNTDTYTSVMRYRLEKKMYDEIIGQYYTYRGSNYTPGEMNEDNCTIAEYCHHAFMLRVFNYQQDDAKIKLCTDEMESLKGQLGPYSFVVEDVDNNFKIISGDTSENNTNSESSEYIEDN